MKRPLLLLLLICLGALALRLGAMAFVRHPGIADANHYYNLANFLLDGRGFNIDYIWQYYNPPASIVHAEDFWMPLTGVLAALAMQVFGHSVPGALALFALMGALVPVIAYAASRQLGCSTAASLFSAAAAAVLPEMVLNSVRTDSTIPNALLIGAAVLLLVRGLRAGKPLALVGSGAAAGLAYLTRGDNLLLLPMWAVTLIAYGLWDRAVPRRRLMSALIVPALALVVAAPWLMRNLQVQGSPLTPNLGRLFFLTDFREHYAYGRDFTLQTMLASQTPAQLVGKRLFEMAASVKTMYTTLDVFLPVAVAGGLLLVATGRQRERLLALAPVLILLGGMYLFYTLLAPIANQGGSFKKSYLTLIPLLLPLAGCALDRAVPDSRLRAGAMLLALVFTAANAVELVRADARFTNTYVEEMRQVAEAARSLPDTNGDGEIILMAQDPFMLRFWGLRSVQIPMESRAVVLEVARRYRVDYLMMPPARPSLDPLYNGTETDSRFEKVVDVAGYVQLYRMREG